jgi:hypothetical protein
MTSLTVSLKKASLGMSGRSAAIFRIGSLSGLLCTLSATAHAQTDSAAARALFADGRTLMEAERYEEACPKFEESLRLDNGMGTQFNLAHCWEKLGRTASAWALFLDVAAAARAGNQPQREAAARERAKALEAKLTRLRIDVVDPAPGMKIERDGQDVGKAAWGTDVPVDPGQHVIVASAPGKKSWSSETQVPASARTMAVKVPTLEDVPVPTSATLDTAQDPQSSGMAAPVEADVSARGGGDGSGQRVVGLVLGGVGLASIATGTVFAIQSRSDNAKLEKLCLEQGGSTCTSRGDEDKYKSIHEDAIRERLFGFIGFGVGGAALITGVVLYMTAGDGTSSAMNVVPLLTGDGGGLGLSGRF